MKIIFSRKGFDSSYGGVPSVILPNGYLQTIPIPENARFATENFPTYNDLSAKNGITLGKLVGDLSKKVKPTDRVHLDPDLDFDSIARHVGWKPIFGQSDSAEGHLQKQKIGNGDIFVFWGWFRNVTFKNGKYEYRDSDKHVIFGWLQVETRLDANNIHEIPEWALSHPHIKKVPCAKKDSIYVAKETLALPNLAKSIPGAGIFKKYSPELCLTAEHQPNGTSNRSLWKLPLWIYPDHKPSTLSYHGDMKRWTKDECGKSVLLKTVARGQEFVLDTTDYPDATDWLRILFENNA
jgi:hypothetical protein